MADRSRRRYRPYAAPHPRTFAARSAVARSVSRGTWGPVKLGVLGNVSRGCRYRGGLDFGRRLPSCAPSCEGMKPAPRPMTSLGLTELDPGPQFIAMSAYGRTPIFGP